MFEKNSLTRQSSAKFAIRSAVALAVIFIGCSQAFAQAYLGNATKTVNLREGPGTDYEALERLRVGAQLFIITAETTNGFLNVIHIETATEGWVHKNFVMIKSAAPRSSGRIFTPEGRSASENPEVLIYNNTSRTLTLNLNNRNYVFEPQERKTLTLTAGTYEYRASAPGVIPYYGEDSLEGNHNYSWEFYIVTRYSSGASRIPGRRRRQ